MEEYEDRMPGLESDSDSEEDEDVSISSPNKRTLRFVLKGTILGGPLPIPPLSKDPPKKKKKGIV